MSCQELLTAIRKNDKTASSLLSVCKNDEYSKLSETDKNLIQNFALSVYRQRM